MDLLTELTIFVLACFVGFEVISKVPNTLHTPLMSGTNAIHGIVIVGGILSFWPPSATTRSGKVLAFIAVAFGTINVVGGFLVTDRMLADVPPASRRPRRRPATRRPREAVTSRRSHSFLQDQDFIQACYIVAAILFIVGLQPPVQPDDRAQRQRDRRGRHVHRDRGDAARSRRSPTTA